LIPMLCVGEKIEQREAGQTEAVVLRQLRAGVFSLSAGAIRSMAVAYEPVWAIGTGHTATPDDAAHVHAVLTRELAAIPGSEKTEVPILYGGSVNPDNAAALLRAPGGNGLRVGGASL